MKWLVCATTSSERELQVEEAEMRISEAHGRISYQKKLDLIQKEERKIADELAESKVIIVQRVQSIDSILEGAKCG